MRKKRIRRMKNQSSAKEEIYLEEFS